MDVLFVLTLTEELIYGLEIVKKDENYAENGVKVAKFSFNHTAFYQMAALEGRSAKSAAKFKTNTNQQFFNFRLLSMKIPKQFNLRHFH